MGAGRFRERSAPNSPGGPLKAYWGHSVFCLVLSPRNTRTKKRVFLERYREILENRESLYGLLLLVCTLRVVRGSRNSKGVSVVIFTAKCAKATNKKGSASGSFSSTLRKICRKGSALNPGQQECFLSLPSYHRWLRKTCESLYWFASPCSRRSRCSRFMFFT